MNQDNTRPAPFYRLVDLIGCSEVTDDQAAKNRAQGKGPKRPRPARARMVPFSAATLWREVKAGRFPAPVKLTEGVTAWPAEPVNAWLGARAAK
jgi:predicted DNA-binding transcriptional regulator AlpA